MLLSLYLPLAEVHLLHHELLEAFTVLERWNAADSPRVVHDGPDYILKALLLSEVRQDVDNAHEVDFCAISRDKPAILRLEESLSWSLPLM